MVDPLLARLIGLVIILLLCLLLVVFTEPAQASGVVPVSTNHNADGDELALVSLALVGGAVILAVGLWIGKLWRTLSK